MTKSFIFQKSFLFLLLFFSFLTISTAETAEKQEKVCVYYFYGQGCAGCEQSNDFLRQLQSKNSLVEIHDYEVYYQPKNMILAEKYFTAYQIPETSRGLPVVFTSTGYFVGESPITTLLEEHIVSSKESNCPSLDRGNATVPGIVGEHSPLDVFTSLSFRVITGGALRDAFRPGAIALLMILGVLLLALPSSTGVLQKGLLFVGVTYGVHFLFAVGMLLHLASSPASIFFYRLIGWLGLLYGVFTVLLFFFGKKIKLLSEATKQKIEFLKQESFTMAWIGILALAASLFSFSGISTTFLVLPHAFRGDSGWAALPIVLYYLALVVLPLLAVVFFLHLLRQYLDLEAEEKLAHIENWKKHYNILLQLVGGVIASVLGLLLLFW